MRRAGSFRNKNSRSWNCARASYCQGYSSRRSTA